MSLTDYFDYSKKAGRQLWLKFKYPLTIVADRYGGSYSGSEFLAFPYEFYELDEDMAGGDTECMMFWEQYKGIVGQGATPADAYEDLINKMRL